MPVNSSNDGAGRGGVRRPALQSLAEAGIIAALYAAATLLLAPFSFGPLQIRFAEALTILPALCASAVPGLAVGCAIANAIGVAMGTNLCGAADILFGTLATLLAALCTRWLRRVKWKGLPVLAALPPVVFNGFIVGAEISYAYSLPYWACALEVAAAELIAASVIGLALYSAAKRLPFFEG